MGDQEGASLRTRAWHAVEHWTPAVGKGTRSGPCRLQDSRRCERVPQAPRPNCQSVCGETQRKPLRSADRCLETSEDGRFGIETCSVVLRLYGTNDHWREVLPFGTWEKIP